MIDSGYDAEHCDIFVDEDNRKVKIELVDNGDFTLVEKPSGWFIGCNALYRMGLKGRYEVNQIDNYCEFVY